MKDKIHIIKSNLKIAEASESVCRNILKSQTEEFSYLIKEASIGDDEASYIFQKVFNKPYLSGEFISCCKLICENDRVLSDFQNSELAENSAAYVDNTYSYTAFQKFNSELSLNADMEKDFNSVCEAVYSDRSRFAVLPLFNSRDGLMISLYKLLQRYDLKIVSSTNVLMNDGEMETEFFLLSHTLPNYENSNYTRLMLSVTHRYGNIISELLTAMSSCGINSLSINTLPLEYTDERCESLITFDISSCSIKAIRMFLRYALPDANIIGIYSIVK